MKVLHEIIIYNCNKFKGDIQKMKNCKISVIVPVYNAEQFLDKCISSIIDQTYNNLEIILINDGSTDNSLDICEKYADSDSRIILISKENGGVSSARNKGLEIATGDYIGFIDSDDYISFDMYEKLLIATVKNDADIAECGYISTTSDYIVTSKHSLKEEVILRNYECSYNYLKQNNTTNFNWNKLYKKTIFEDIRYSNYKYSEDYVVNVKAFYKCNKKVAINDCCYYHVVNQYSATQQKFKETKLDIIKAGKEVLEFYEAKYPQLCNLAIIYILNKIRRLYEDLAESNVLNKKEIKEILINEYKNLYPLVKKDLKKTVTFKKTYVALWIFNKSPYFYYVIEKLRKSN